MDSTLICPHSNKLVVQGLGWVQGESRGQAAPLPGLVGLAITSLF